MMADRILPAKVILLAVDLTSHANITALQALVSTYRKTLRNDIVLRILLSYLPETLESSKYVPFLLSLTSTTIASSNTEIDTTSIKAVEDEDAIKRVRKLHLEPLLWPNAPADVPSDPFTRFLIHRAHRVDRETGLSAQLPELIIPFLDHSPYLRTWMVSTILPLLRLNYEYYPKESTSQTIEVFEEFEDREGVRFLLSRISRKIENTNEMPLAIGRDLRGLIGPWMYGDNRSKRRKLRRASSAEAQTVEPLDQTSVDDSLSGWDEVFKWIVSQASSSWETCVEAIVQWDGPSDVDLGGYAGAIQLEDHEQQMLEHRYARAALASVYLIQEASNGALTGAHTILCRIASLLDLELLPDIATATSLLSPISVDEGQLQCPSNAKFLCNDMLDDCNILTTPNRGTVDLLHGIVLSAFILSRTGSPCSIRKAGQLSLLQDESDQMEMFNAVLAKISDGPKGDDKYWIRSRNELLWLHSWGAEEISDDMEQSSGKGVFGKISRSYLEKEILKALLSNTRYTLARSIYESSTKPILPKDQILETVVHAAMNAYDNASNANRTRGGVKKCNDILESFPATTNGTEARRRIEALLKVTHSIGKYRLVLKQGEPFAPIDLRIQKDPIAVIGKVLEQNPQSYTKINEFIDIAGDMVLAGLTIKDVEAKSNRHVHHELDHQKIALKRVQAMCIDAALNEDDFETAYSFILTRLSAIDSGSQKPASCKKCNNEKLVAEAPITVFDDWSWRAALQAGKYRSNSRTVLPTHVGNSSGNLEIRHLEQRLECISLALRIAPAATLQEILNAFRRCEEELEVKIKEDADAEKEWDNRGDQTSMPGGFGPDPRPLTLSRHQQPHKNGEEGPISIFDLTKASATQAQKTLSALSGLKLGSARSQELSAGSQSAISARSSGEISRDEGGARSTVRKRDQLREAAVGTLASSVGWLIGANAGPVRPKSSSGRSDTST